MSYKGAGLELFGLPRIPMPGSSSPGGGEGRSGLLVPDIRYDRVNGLELSLPYYLQIAPHRHLTVTPHIYSDTLPMAEVNYQSLLSKGAYQVTGYVTYGSSIPTSSGPGASEQVIRGYTDASDKFKFNQYGRAHICTPVTNAHI